MILAGGVIVTAVELIPLIGPLTELAVAVVGIGAIMQSQQRRWGGGRPPGADM